MIDDLYNIFGNQKDPDDQYSRAVALFFKKKAMADLSDTVLDALYDSEDEKLDREEKRLSIAHKRRALGLPWSGEDYELATNEGLSFTQKGAVAAFGKHIADRIPSPGFLAPPTGRGLMETRFPNTTKVGPLDALLSDGSIIGKGAKHVGKLRGIARWFGR